MSNFQIARGATFATTTTCKKNGAPFNLTGARVLFVAKINPTDSDGSAVAILDNQMLGGVVVTDAANGIVNITMSAAATFGLSSVTLLYYEVWVKDSGNNEWRTEFGQIVLLPRILVAQP